MFYGIFLLSCLICYSFSRIESTIHYSNSPKFLQKSNLISFDKTSFILSTTDFIQNFTTCGAPNLPLVMKNPTFSSKPAKGQQFNITLKGYFTAHEDLKLVRVQTLLGTQQLNKEDVFKTDVLEPFDAFLFIYLVNLPSFVLSGKYTVAFNIFNVNQENIGCVTFDFDL